MISFLVGIWQTFLRTVVYRILWPFALPAPPAAREQIQISQLWIYPVKSCRGISLPRSQLCNYGLQWDRMWVILDADGVFMTQRTYPRMALITPQLVTADQSGDASTVTGITLSAEGMDDISVPIVDEGSVEEFMIWEDRVMGISQGVAVAEWLSTFLEVKCQLFLKDSRSVRSLPSKYVNNAHAVDYDTPQTAFADGYPILLISQESFDDINGRLADKGITDLSIGPRNFRPNIVVFGANRAFAEDEWSHLECGNGLVLHCVKPCTRCTLPNVNPDTGVPRPDGQPLKVIMSYRRVDNRFKYEAIVGVNLVHSRFAPGDCLETGQTLDAHFPTLQEN